MSSSVECIKARGNDHRGKRKSTIAMELINIRTLPGERNLQWRQMRKEPVLLKSDVRSGLVKMKTNKASNEIVIEILSTLNGFGNDRFTAMLN